MTALAIFLGAWLVASALGDVAVAIQKLAGALDE